MNQIHSRADFNLFRVLEAIDRTGGISRAADSLNLTQSAVSHALGRLRTLLDDPLFVRQGQNMVPTTFARSLMPKVRRHLSGLSHCIETAQEFDPASLECRFQIGFRDAAESLVFPFLMPTMAQAAPGVQIVSRRIEPGSLERELSQGQIDLAADIATNVGPQIRSKVMFAESAVIMYRHGHPAIANQLIDMDSYAAAHHIMVTLQPDSPELLDNHLADLGIRRHIILKCQHYFAACQVVAKTDWLLLMPQSLAISMSKLLPIKYCACPFPTPKIELRLYWHEAMDQDQGNLWLREVASGFMHTQRARVRPSVEPIL